MPSQEVGIIAAVQICSQFLQFFCVGSSSQNYKNGARIDENKNSYSHVYIRGGYLIIVNSWEMSP